MKKPVRYHGFVHTLESTDKRRKKYLKQLKTIGFDSTESWDFGPTTLTSFIYPRFKKFKHTWERPLLKETGEEWKKEYNQDAEEFNKKLDEVELAFELIYNREVEKILKNNPYTQEEEETKIAEGLKAFAEIYLALWN